MTQYPTPLEQQYGANLSALLQRVAVLERQMAHLTTGATPVTSTTHPVNPATGMLIFETNTGNTLLWDGSAWRTIQTGAWTSYTPVWTSSGTAPSLGNGTLAGYYSKTGRTVSVRIDLSGGSTTTWGTGGYNLTLPFNATTAGVPAGGFVWAGSIDASVAGGTTFYDMNAVILPGSPGTINGLVSGSGAFWGQGNPATWSTTAFMAITCTYESAS